MLHAQEKQDQRKVKFYYKLKKEVFMKKITILVMIFLVVILICNLYSQSKEVKEKEVKQNIRKSVLAGSWYPENKDKLLELVDSIIKEASKEVKEVSGNVVGLVVPHAGYQYSGLGAVSGYNLLSKSQPKRIFIIAFSHHFPFVGISLPNFTHYETPVGLVQVDMETRKEILQYPPFNENEQADKNEHSLEIQLPLLQRILKEFKIVPLYVGSLTKEQFKEAAKVLSKYIDDKTVMIASSDFTHYGPNYGYLPFPTDDKIKENLSKLDNGSIEKILNFDPEGFISYINETGTTICGRYPIQLLLETLLLKKEPLNIKSSLVKYYTSGDKMNDYKNSVSYVTIAFTK